MGLFKLATTQYTTELNSIDGGGSHHQVMIFLISIDRFEVM